MNFTVESKIVKDYALLIKHGRKTLDDVPNVGNLKEVVADVLAA